MQIKNIFNFAILQNKYHFHIKKKLVPSVKNILLQLVLKLLCNN